MRIMCHSTPPKQKWILYRKNNQLCYVLCNIPSINNMLFAYPVKPVSIDPKPCYKKVNLQKNYNHWLFLLYTLNLTYIPKKSQYLFLLCMVFETWSKDRGIILVIEKVEKGFKMLVKCLLIIPPEGWKCSCKIVCFLLWPIVIRNICSCSSTATSYCLSIAVVLKTHKDL